MSNLELESTITRKNLLPVKMQCSLDIELNGVFAKVKLTQTFTNTSDKPIEASHSIPVPVESTLTDFRVVKGNQTWQGVVIEKQQADQKFEEALEKGDTAFQLKRSEGDVISVFLGNLLSKETVQLELSLIFPIQFLAGQGQLYFPLVMGERFGQSNLLPEATPENSFLAEYPLSIKIKTTNLPIEVRISSPSHALEHKPVTSCYRAEGQLDRDLKILFDSLEALPPQLQMVAVEEESMGIATIMIPTQDDEKAEPRDILFLLDCSASMRGSPIQQLKESMVEILNHLRPQDRFNLYPFGSNITQVFDDIKTVEESSITTAKQFIRRNLEANMGGTAMIEAMLFSLMAYQKTRATDVVLITDGEIWLREESVEYKLLKAYAKQNNIRFFTLGVGHAQTEKTVQHLADISDGSALLVNPNEEIQFQIKAHVKRLYQSAVSFKVNQAVTWQKSAKGYSGDVLIVPFRVKGKPTDLTLNIDSEQTQTKLNRPAQFVEDSDLKKWIADQSFAFLDGIESATFAVKHQILTSQTDYLVELIRAEGEKSEEMPSFVKVPQMNVHGREDYGDLSGIRFSMKSTDTSNKSSLSMIIKEKVAQYSEKKQYKLVKAYIKELLATGEQPNYSKLVELNVPVKMQNLIRLAELEDNLEFLLKRLVRHFDDHDTLVGLYQFIESLQLKMK